MNLKKKEKKEKPSLLKEYFSLTEKYIAEYGNNTILLMLVGVFYEVYGYKDENGNYSGSRILEFSQICELQIGERNKPAVMAGFKDIMLEKYLRKLQEAMFTIVVYKQEEKDEKIIRSLEAIYSPGTYFSPYSIKLTNNIACVWVDVINYKREKIVIVGMANIDIYTGKSNIFEYQEKYILNPTTFDELERFISIYEPVECIFISNIPEAEDIIIEFANIKSNPIHKINTKDTNSSEKTKRVKNCEKQTYQMEILKRFYSNRGLNEEIIDVFFQNFYTHAIASQTFCFLLDFIYQHNPYLVHKIHEPFFENCSDRLILANHSLKQLNMIQDNSCDERNNTSVMKILNKCLTPMGKRMFIHKLLNPTTNEEYLQTEYDITEKILNHNFEANYLFFSQRAREIKDLSKWERQIILKKMPPKSLYIW
jgi:DNA mismatch repair protein MutS